MSWSLPVTLPVFAKLILNDLERPALRVSGNESPLTLNRTTLTVARLKIRLLSEKCDGEEGLDVQ